MSIEVDMTREETQSYHSQVFKANSPDKVWYFSVRFSENQLEEIETYIKDKLDTREYKDITRCYPYLDARIYTKMKIEPSKIVSFDPEGLKLLPEVIKAFRDKVGEIMGLATHKPKQKILTEIKSKVAVKPKKKV